MTDEIIARCWWCERPLGKAATVAAPDAGSATFHKQGCWEAWRRAQRFRRGRAPAAVLKTDDKPAIAGAEWPRWCPSHARWRCPCNAPSPAAESRG